MLLMDIMAINFLSFLHMHDVNSLMENIPVVIKAIFTIVANIPVVRSNK